MPQTFDILIVSTQAPYSNGAATEALELALASASFDRKVAFLLSDKGVFQLLKNQDSTTIQAKSLNKQLKALPMFGIDHCLVSSAALKHYDVEMDQLDSSISVQTCSEQDLQEIYAHAQHVIRF